MPSTRLHVAFLVVGTAFACEGRSRRVEVAGDSAGTLRVAPQTHLDTLPAFPEDSVVLPSSRGDSAIVASLAAWRAHIDSPSGTAALTLHLAALIDGNRVVPVRDSTSWPDSTEVSYGVQSDGKGRVVSAYAVPTSRSGDWFNMFTYYFDTLGHTLLFERHSSFFNGCEHGGARETSISFIDPTTRLVARTYKLTAFDTTARVDPHKCEFLYRHPYTVYMSWEAVAKATGLEILDLGHAK